MSHLRRRLVSLTAVVAFAAAAVSGVLWLSSQSNSSAKDPVARRESARADRTSELRISRDFGGKTLLHRQLSVSSTSTAMSLLSQNADVETAYGGNFVNSIQGLASGYTGGGSVRADWFYFVNGIQANRGAADFDVKDADSIWWDFHRWDYAPSVPAVVGQFPQPFLSGEARNVPTLVEYAEGSAGAAEKIVEALRKAGVEKVESRAAGDDPSFADSRHTIVVGTWESLSRASALTSALEAPAGTGIFARIEDGELVTLDYLGTPHASGKPAGVVFATATPSQDIATTWVVSGSDAQDVDAAAGLFGSDGPALQGRFGVAVFRDGSTIGLPVKPQ